MSEIINVLTTPLTDFCIIDVFFMMLVGALMALTMSYVIKDNQREDEEKMRKLEEETVAKNNRKKFKFIDL